MKIAWNCKGCGIADGEAGVATEWPTVLQAADALTNSHRNRSKSCSVTRGGLYLQAGHYRWGCGKNPPDGEVVLEQEATYAHITNLIDQAHRECACGTKGLYLRIQVPSETLTAA